MLNGTSLSSLWSVINQVQIFFLLLITGAYIPEDVKEVITGQKILQNPSGLISFSENSYYSTLLSKFDFELSNSSYSLLGLKSNSTAYNAFPCFIFLLLLM